MEIKKVKLLPTIYDLSPFVDRDHPTDLHPESALYRDYWGRFEQKMVEGLWGFDGIKKKNKTLGGWRYMPPCLFYFVNGAVVPVQRGQTFVPIKPFCHDLEWIFSYNWLTCRGFSGCEDDPKRSCFRPLLKMIRKQPLTEDDKYRIDMSNGSYLKKNGTFKEYVDALTYLKQTHPEAMGLPLYENTALDLLTFGSRGGTKTSFSAICCTLHEYKTYGMHRYNSDYFKAARKKAGKRILISTPVEKNLNDYIQVLTLNLNYVKNELGAYRDGPRIYPGAFHQRSEGKLEGNNVKRPYKHVIKYTALDEEGKQTPNELASGAEIHMALSTTENPAPGTGGRYTVMPRDEVGKNPNYKRCRELEEACMAIDSKFGSSFDSGTSGELDKVGDAYYFFYNPEINNILAFDNEYEPGEGKIAFFLSALYTDRKVKDEMGNTDLDRAALARMEVRELLKNDPEKLAKEKIRYPVIPSEMFGSGKSYTLPKDLAAQHLIYLDRTKDYIKKAETGNFVYNEEKKTVHWEKDNKLKDKMLTEHDAHLKEKSLYGVPVVYEHPAAILPTRKIYGNLHKAICDPIKDDGTEGKVSLFCGYIYKGIPDKKVDSECLEGTLVFSIICRRDEAEAGLEIMFYACMYYECFLLFEGNVGPVMTLARLKGWLHLLQPTPHAALSKGQSAKDKYGVVMTTERKSIALPLLNGFYKQIHHYDQFGDPVTTLQTIYCRMQIEQVMKWHNKPGGNFDTVSCMLVLMYWLMQELSTDAAQPDQKEYEELQSSILKLFSHDYENLEINVDIWD